MPETQEDFPMNKAKYIIVTEKPDLFTQITDRIVMTPSDFIAMKDFSIFSTKTKVINLSNRYDYLSKGYYVSLLAEARGNPCIPDASNIISLNWKRNHEFAIPELNSLLEKNYKEKCIDPLTRTYTSFFGRHENPAIELVTRRVFDLFRFPVISIEIKCVQNGKWAVNKIDTPPFTSLIKEQSALFHDALAKFTGSAWKNQSNKKQERYWIAILHNPDEQHSPSNKAALKKFITIGKKMGLWVELITKQDFSTLLEFDALFIRETTAINNHTFRFASKAEQEDIPCIDDPTSIIRCCNKVYLKELLEKHKLPIPKTTILDKKNVQDFEKKIELPCVLKVPDGSFSRGVSKVKTIEEFRETASTLFQKSEIILAQEYMPSEYDWRIGVLNNEPIFANKYFMAKGHWQIYNHEAKKKNSQYGAHTSIAIEDVPENVLKTAISATKAIGKSLYGVDLKQLEDGRIVVIEVNDNPNIDHGVEDEILGDALYEKILGHIVKMIES